MCLIQFTWFSGQKDIVRCFHCDTGLAEWTCGDDPWIEHARHCQDCPYLLKHKGKHFVDNVQREWSKVIILLQILRNVNDFLHIFRFDMF